jgi:hypothetical protein
VTIGRRAAPGAAAFADTSAMASGRLGYLRAAPDPAHPSAERHAVSMTYREIDPRSLADIAAHLGLATALLDQFVAIPKRMTVAKPRELRELEHEARTAWEALWDQLAQTRALVRALGRDSTAYDAARQSAGDLWLDAARVDIHTSAAGRTTFTWHTAPTAPAKAAIEALRAVVPEVVVSEPPPQDLELQPMRKRIERYGPLLAIIAAVAWAIVRFAL